MKIVRNIFVSLFLLLSYSSVCLSQQWQTFNTSNSGIPSNTIYDIAFDGEGNIWFASNNGLAKYDWNNWTVLNSSNSGLLTDVITEVTFAEDGTMWVGCTSDDPFGNDSTGGLVRYKNSVWTAFTTQNSDLNYPFITEIETVGLGEVWVWSYWPAIPEQNGLLQIFNGTSWTAVQDTSTSYSVYTINDLCSNNGIGYAAMGYDGLAVLQDSLWRIYNTSNSNLSGVPITSVTADDTGNVWFSIYTFSLSPLNKFNGSEFYNVPVPFSYGQVGSVDIDPDGVFWFGTYFNGLIKLDGDQVTEYTTSNSPLVTNNVRIIEIDNEGRIWLLNEQQPGITVFDPDGLTGINDDKTDLAGIISFKLFQNYPNPFNPTTKIIWQSPVAGHQSLIVYDILGNEAAVLINEYRPAGYYVTELNAENLTSGIYFVRIVSGTYSETIKINLVK